MPLKYDYNRHKTLIIASIQLQLIWCVTTTILLGLVLWWMVPEPRSPAQQQQAVSVLWSVTHPLSLTSLIITTTIRGGNGCGSTLIFSVNGEFRSKQCYVDDDQLPSSNHTDTSVDISIPHPQSTISSDYCVLIESRTFDIFPKHFKKKPY